MESLQITQSKGRNLPKSHRPYIDKYFLRANEILKAEGINPWVRAQVFIRKGPGRVYGVDEALDIFNTYSPLVKNGGRVYALKEGANYNSKDTLMLIEARIQDIIELETMYLGVLSAETTKANDGHGVDLEQVTNNTKKIVKLVSGRPVHYFGARHWRYDEDAAITRAAYEGGATGASTDIGAETFGQKGNGTIPHASENIKAWQHGYENAVVESTKSFDKIMNSSIPRIALIDYANREIDDSIATANALEGRLYAVRVDTCGENIAQGAIDGDKKYWEGHGVTVSGVKSLREALDNKGHEDVKIILTSGFGNDKKVEAFLEGEQKYGMKLFDGLGVGGLYEARMATMDLVAIGNTLDDMTPMSKIGREYNPNPKLELRLGGKNENNFLECRYSI